MGSSATLARHRSWGEVIAVVAIILGMLAGGAVTAAPAWADAACSDADGNTFDFSRMLLELDEVGGDGLLTVDTIDEDVTCESRDDDQSIGANALRVYLNGDQIITEGGSDSPDFHLSCSDDIADYTITIGGTEYSVTSYILDSRGPSGYTGTCEEFPSTAPVASLATGECEFDQVSTYPVTYSLAVNDGDGPFALFVDGVEDTTVTLTEGADQPLGDFDPGTALEIRDGDTVLASTSVADATCPPDPDPTPAITLVKDAVVGEGSDLIDLGPNPLLQFSDSETGSQTALYSYLITNTGDEALINISLTDDRIASADLDFSDCTAKEPLAPGDTCTATGSEDFTLEQAQAVVDDTGIVTNTGTVTADGEESGDEVSATDPATIVFELVFSEVQEKEDPDPAVDSDAEEKDPAVLSAADELPATGLDDDGLLPLALLLIAMGAALLWLDRPWLGVR